MNQRRRLANKCLRLWSKKVKELAGGRCVFCGETKGVNAHHILDSRLWPSLRFDLKNGLACCFKHHRFGPDAVHKNFVVLYDYMTTYRKEDLEYLRRKSKGEERKKEWTEEELLKKIKELEEVV